MNDMDDITKALAQQYNKGISLKPDEEKKPEPAREVERVSYSRPASSAPRSGISYESGVKIWPSEKFDLKTTGSDIIMPKRPPINMLSYSDEDLEWMFSTPVKRGWEFKDWLEVIGLPTDLNAKHDGAAYQYAARAYLNRKKESHQR
jgi:hypothetical protein